MPWVLRGRQGRGPNQEHRESGGQGVIGGNLLGVAPDFYETWGWGCGMEAVLFRWADMVFPNYTPPSTTLQVVVWCSSCHLGS